MFSLGCDIINLSLGGPNNWAQDVSSLVANRIAKKGVPVVIAAGNDGERGAFYISSPSTGKQVISVASINNNVTLAMTMQANNRSFSKSFFSSAVN
jgi:subtilisin family serine protease